MKIQVISVMTVLAVMVSACATNQQQSNENFGAILGGIAGGFLGSQFGEGGGKTAATIGGALIGTWVGKNVARGMTAGDRRYYEQAATRAHAAPVGQSVEWNNPQTGHRGTITPTREGKSYAGEYCREYQQTVMIDGRTERAYGTACQQQDGSWRIVN